MSRARAMTGPVVAPLGLLILALSLPYWLIQTQYILSVVIVATIWAVAGQGWNLSGGYGGLLSFGHSVFFGVGAYTTALLQLHAHLSPWIGIWAGAAVAAAVGAILTFPALRLKGVYFTLATFVLSLLFSDLATVEIGVTGGDQGLTLPFRLNDPGMFVFGSKVTLYNVLVLFAVGATLVVSLVSRSRLGLFLRATRDDPDAARAAGVNVTRTRLVGLMLSAAVTGIAGSLMLEYIGSTNPTTAFSATTGFTIALVTLVGGRGTVLGPILGAAVLIPVQQIFSSTFASGPLGLSGMAYAAVVVIVMLLEPRGLLQLVLRLIARPWRRLSGGNDVATLAGGPAAASERGELVP